MPDMQHRVLVGTSGWQYDDWRGVLYEQGLPKREWLAAYAARFRTVENNNAFYRLPETDTFTRWRDTTPDGFVMAVKASRFLTHVKRLRDPAEPVARLMERAAGLGARLGPVLLQLPPTMQADPERLAETLARFPAHVRVAVEPRHASWWSEETRAVLAEHEAALCWSDRRGRPLTPLWATASWGYLRLHEGAARPWPRYGRAALSSWVGRLREAYGKRAEAYVYFNNDQHGAAVEDADAFSRLLRRR